MSQLLGPNGRPISSHKKSKPTALGPSFGQWVERDSTFNQMPGGAILQFNLDALTLADYRAMRYHPQLNACLSVLTFMLHQVDWHLECPKDKKMAQELEDNLKPVWTRLVRGISQSFWAGYSPMAVEVENNVPERRVEITKFKDLVPEDCKVHWKEVEGGYAPPGRMRPKFKVYDGIEQFGAPWPIPAENTLWYPLLMENGNYYGRKLLKAAFAPWYFSTLVHLFANRYYERFGEPVPVGRAPFDQDFVQSDGSVITGKEAMENILMNLRNRSVVVIPNDIIPGSRVAGDKTAYEYSIDYLESQMRGADFERYLTRLDEEMSLSLFTPLLLLRNSDVGSNSLGVQHTQTWLWMLNALTGDMGEYITRYPVQRLKAYNFSEKAPWVTWKARPMGKENAETLRAIVAALISSGDIRPDVDQLGEALGMTLNEVKQVTRDNIDTSPTPGDTPTPDPKLNARKGLSEPRATCREVSTRVRGQVEKAWRSKLFGPGFNPDMGYHKRFIQSLMAEGTPGDEAESIASEFYGKTERWMQDAIALGADGYTSPNDFMAMFDRFVDSEIEVLCQ